MPGTRKAPLDWRALLVAHGPLRAGFGTLITAIRLPGGHRARSLAPLCMCEILLCDYGPKSQPCPAKGTLSKKTPSSPRRTMSPACMPGGRTGKSVSGSSTNNMAKAKLLFESTKSNLNRFPCPFALIRRNMWLDITWRQNSQAGGSLIDFPKMKPVLFLYHRSLPFVCCEMKASSHTNGG